MSLFDKLVLDDIKKITFGDINADANADVLGGIIYFS